MKSLHRVWTAVVLFCAVTLSSAVSLALTAPAPVWLHQTAVGYDAGSSTYFVTIQWQHGIADAGQSKAESFAIYRSLVGPSVQDKDFDFVGTVNSAEAAQQTVVYTDNKVGKGVYYYFVRGVVAGIEGERSERVMVVAPGSYCVNLDNPELRFTTFPPMVVAPGSLYTYKSYAEHRSLRVQGWVRYEMVEGPKGATIDEKTGTLQWQTPSDITDNVHIKIRAYSLESKTAEDVQEWYLRFATASELKTGGTTSTGAEEAVINTFLHPNPANDVLRVQCTSLHQATTQISVINTMGATLFSSMHTMNASDNHLALDVSNLAVGRYTLRIASGSGVSSYPVVIVR